MSVCILHVGGTIGMIPTDDGLVPQVGFLEEYLAGMPELSRANVPEHRLVRLDPLLDSADMTPNDWVRIARAIVERYDEFDGFVVLHGTDTMAYTASALSFLLPGLSKPVILSGSQLSLEDVRSDGREHIITSVIIAGTLAIPEVCIYFGARLFRGNRAQKVHNADFIAFSSGNLAPLASVGVHIEVNRHLVRPAGPGVPAEVDLSREPQVAAIRLFPGIRRGLLEGLLAPPTDGVVLETYGAGNFPSLNPGLLEPIHAATSRTPPVVVVNCSQCHGGAVVQDTYRAGRALTAAGVLSGRDMTPEAALTKLYCLLASGHDPSDVGRLMLEDMAGELDPDTASGEKHT